MPSLHLSGINLRSFEIFDAVAECGSMTGAAERFGITQSAVSQTIRAFEEAVGQRLFDRSMRPPALTLAGTSVRHHARKILDGMQGLAAAVGPSPERRLPKLRIGMANTVAVTIGPLLFDRIRHLAQSWSVASGQSETRIEGLIQRRVDMIVTFDPLPPPEDFLVLPVLTEPYFLALPASFTQDPGILTALSRQLDLVRYGPRLHLADQVESYLEQQGVSAPERYRLDTIDAVLAMVAAGLGWALATPLSLLKSPSLAGSIRCAPLPAPGLARQLVIITRSSEDGGIGRLIQREALSILATTCLPALHTLLPDLAPTIRLAASPAAALTDENTYE